LNFCPNKKYRHDRKLREHVLGNQKSAKAGKPRVGWKIIAFTLTKTLKTTITAIVAPENLTKQ
jgi:hypothetical protein